MLRHEYRSVAVLVVAAAAMCTSPDFSLAAEATKPARVEEITGSELKRVILTAEAAQRVAIEMGTVREEPVKRWLLVDGEVEAVPDQSVAAASAATATDAADAASPIVPVRVRIPRLDDPEVVARQTYIVLSLGDDDNGDDDEKEADDVNDTNDGNKILVLTMDGNSGEVRTPLDQAFSGKAQYFEMSSTDHSLTPGQRVQVKLAQPDSGKPQKTVPYSAVIYDLHGKTWIYSSPEPLVFVRQPITVEYVHQDVAVLTDGPATGTAIVSVGAAQLMGVEQRGAK